MNQVKIFAAAAAGAVDELLSALSPDDRERIAEAFKTGTPLSVSFSLRAGTNGTVRLELGDPAGERQTLVSVDAKQHQFH